MVLNFKVNVNIKLKTTYLWTFVFIFLIFTKMHASDCSENSYTISLRGGGLLPSDHIFKRVYGNNSGFYEVEATQHWKQNWYIWENFDWYAKKGRSIEIRTVTRIYNPQLSGGLKYQYCINDNFRASIGLGPSMAYVFTKDKDYYRHHRSKSRFTIGGVVKLQLDYYFNSCVFASLFVDYLYQPTHYYRHLSLGGFKPGVGLGYAF